MDCASAQTVSWFASIFSGYAAKNREPPKSPSLQNLDVLRSTIAGQGVFPAHAEMIPTSAYRVRLCSRFPRSRGDDPVSAARVNTRKKFSPRKWG